MSRIEDRTFSTVHITELTLQEIVQAVKEAKEKGGEYAEVATPYSLIRFEVHLENEILTQESLGYKLRGCGLEGEQQIRNFVVEKGLAEAGSYFDYGLKKGQDG